MIVYATFLRRKTALPEEVPDGLSGGFAEDKTKQNQWNAFVRRTRLKLPCEDLNIIVAERLCHGMDEISPRIGHDVNQFRELDKIQIQKHFTLIFSHAVSVHRFWQVLPLPF